MSHETARTVGQSNHEILGGFGQVGYVFKWNYGATENLDLGLYTEALNTGLRAKYAFLNSSAGWSFATALGTGVSIGGTTTNIDLITSYATGSWEPYGTVRLVQSKTDPIEFKDKNTGQVDFTIEKSEFSYGQFILGNRFWFSPHWLLSVEASTLFPVSSGFGSSRNWFASLALGYRF